MVANWLRNLGIGIVLGFLPLSSPLPAAPSQKVAPVAELVKTVDIPYQQFTLDNGLRVIVSTDRKAPVVAVSIWYHVGSKNEPKGKTGFAHLFEHLMFNGSENADGEFFVPLENAGATDFNGTTWFDRTNYFETVPTGALELALFLESDRMGHLLGAVTKEKLDNQRNVVQNEKRQGDNQPFGLVEYAQLAALFPEGHPYRHSTIGSMADLDAASLEDVRSWFRAHYGPNNAVLVLAGDIDAEAARPLVEKYFGDIPRGPEQPPVTAPVPTLSAPVEEVMKDKVATTRIYRMWTVPGLNDPDAVNLDVATSVLGGLASSRLDNELVKKQQLAVAVSAGLQAFEKVGLVEVYADVKPGVDPAVAGRALDRQIEKLLKEGPTADEVRRVATGQVASRIAGLEKVGGFGGKAVALAEGAIYANDPEFYKRQLARYAAATPASVKAAAAKWLTRPAYRLMVEPGEREPDDVAAARNTGVRPRYYADPDVKPVPAAEKAAPQTAAVTKRKAPDVKPVDDLEWPDVERTKLSNGMEVVFARRATVPTVRLSMSFDAGYAADDKAKLGTHAMMLALMDEGTRTRSSIDIAEEQERLGAVITPEASMDRTDVSLFALKPNLAPSLALFADIVRNPAFAAGEVERVRGQMLTKIRSEKTQPSGLALRELPPLLYGKAHPYGIPFTGTGDEQGVTAVTRDDLAAHHRHWLRPDNATIFAVGDTTLAELTPLLEAQFGDWRSPAGAKPAKLFRMDRMARPARIVVIDRPGPQSLILAGQTLGVEGTDDPLTLITANEVLGGSFVSRLNMDLREAKGWSYGVGTQVRLVRETVPFLLFAPVQTDRTGDSVKALIGGMQDFLTKSGVTAEELGRTINNQVRSLPGSFETSSQLLGAIARNATFERPDDYYETLADRYRAMDAADLDAAARRYIRPNDLIWVIVGDAAKVGPQLQPLGLPVEVMKAE
ncbi:peptidase M16 [Tardibacter chloracetimidivorans]|uniref:Peptidase M16 n=1 Tax=Tardibacter chloracetimidivorans TaxID=1921510 RepID=A0A1L3ZWH8_9SPHN|nr:pitrilysin family protein [Tardibacter chloracetimidivorans]API59984.1 peptidase M16 [Tardibacter chloracetimidivorans]